MNRILKSAFQLCRDHTHFLIIVPLLIIVTTWPLTQQILDVHTPWRPPGDADVLIEFWDAWYGKRLFSGQADYFHTDVLFYPRGLSLAYHNLGIPHMLAFGSLQSILPTVNAYLLAYLLLVFVNACAAYLYLLYIIADKWIALAGALIFSFSPYFFAHMHHPDLCTVATIPFTLYAFHRGIVEERWQWLAAAGAAAGISAFVGLYIVVCLFFTMAAYTLFLALTRRFQRRFWLDVALTLLVASAIGLVRLYPMIIDADLLREALAKGADTLRSADLLLFFVNPRHPLTPALFETLFHRAPPVIYANGYLGLLPLALIVVGFLFVRNRRRMTIWLILTVCFVALRLGHILQIDGQVYPGVLLPKYYLDAVVPWLTQGFWDTTFFQIGILMPVAVLCCYALQAIVGSVPPRRRAGACLLVIAIVAFEYYQPPIPSFRRYEPQYQWIDWLQTEDYQDSIHLINLPMGRNRSKRYLYHQTLHGYPQVEGLASRTPEVAYDYIESNLLLDAWRAGISKTCLPDSKEDFVSAHAELLADGFTHIVLHRGDYTDEHLVDSFLDIPASYADEHVLIYRLKDMRDTCDATATLGETLTDYTLQLNRASPISSGRDTAVLALYALETPSANMEESQIAVLHSEAGLLRLDIDQLIDALNSDLDLRVRHGYDHLVANSVVIFAYDPGAADPHLRERYRAWLSRQYDSCGPFADTDAVAMEVFLRAGFPCELAVTDAALSVQYDNGIQLGNAIAKQDGDMLNLYLLWKRLPLERHAVSFQLFDGRRNKVHGQDFAFRDQTLANHTIDLSTLEAGTYAAKLIVYHYETGASVPGTVLSSQMRFDRELELMTLTIN